MNRAAQIVENQLSAQEPPLRSWPSAERPRERLEALGVRQLADAELLAMVLRTGSAGASALTLARKLQALAGLRGGFGKLQLSDLRALRGVGSAKAAAVLAALEWGRRQQMEPRREGALRGPGAACEALRALLGDSQQEQVAVLALDARRRVLAQEVVSQGTLTQSLAHPREIFRTAIKLGAAAVVVGHNHPSGDPAPSPDDHALTRRLRESAEILGIPLVDHIIVGRDGFHSYADTEWRI
ncbi:MAG TPA: DNA repair protein RadC [bacterium]|jgi:DNA repair protein RadC|nr:DNA repair protein RadC [bacterium]